MTTSIKSTGLNMRMLFLMGFIVFSPLSSYITISLLHLPISLPELLLLPFLPFCHKKIRFSQIISQNLIFLLIAYLGLLVISLLFSDARLYEILGSSRTYLYIFIFFVYFSRSRTVSTQDIFILATGATLGWLLTSIIGFRTVTLMGKINMAYGPMLVIPLGYGYAMLSKRMKIGIVLFVVLAFIGVIGALRRELAVLIFTTIMILSYMAVNHFNRFFKSMIAFICISFIIFININAITSAIEQSSHTLYNRVVTKTESMFNGKSNQGDKMRVDFINNLINSLDNYIVPKGFVSKQFSWKNKLGEFNDLPLKEVLHVFSIWIVAFMFFYFSYLSYIILKRKNNVAFCDRATLIIGYLNILLLLFIEGSFLTYPYVAIYTGYILGGIQKESGVKFFKLYNNRIQGREIPHF